MPPYNMHRTSTLGALGALDATGKYNIRLHAMHTVAAIKTPDSWSRAVISGNTKTTREARTSNCHYHEDPIFFETWSSALVAKHDASNSRRDVGRIHGLHKTGRVLAKVWDAELREQLRVVSMVFRVTCVRDAETIPDIR
jgi:hypothetical protein